MHFSILSDLKKTTAVVENLSTTSTRCSVTEITSLLQETNIILHQEIDPLVEEGIKVEIEEITIIETITDPITETDQEADGTIIGQVIGVIITKLTIDKVILDQIMDKMLNGHSETEVKAEIELEITIMTTQEVEVEIDTMTNLFSQDKVEEMSLGPGSTLE